VTSRGKRRAKNGGGLGLGLFIAKTLLERSGARIAMRNASGGARGAEITIVWPRSAFERGVGASGTSFYG
jgi:two-component system sensor histidine kinase RegB